MIFARETGVNWPDYNHSYPHSCSMFDSGVTSSAVAGSFSRINSTAVNVIVSLTVNSHSIVAATPYTSGAVDKGVTVAYR